MPIELQKDAVRKPGSQGNLEPIERTGLGRLLQQFVRLKLVRQRFAVDRQRERREWLIEPGTVEQIQRFGQKGSTTEPVCKLQSCGLLELVDYERGSR